MVAHSTLLVFIASYMHYVGTGIVQGATVVLYEPEFAIEGGTFVFNCTVEGSIEPVQSFNWYHNGSLIDQHNLRISTRMYTWYNLLEVTSSVREDGGEYYCGAVFTDTNETSNRYILQIKGVFSVHVNVESMFEAILHSKIELKCSVDAFPTPTIKWYRLNINDEVTKLVLTHEAGDPKYGILERNVTREDDGKWRCTASSSHGGKSSDFIITVIVPPVNTSISLLTNKTVQRDADFQLQCNSNVEHSPKFTWTYNGTNLTKLATGHSPNSRYEVDTDLGLLTVKVVTYGDTGVFTCIVMNRAGSDRANFTVDVEGAPEILIHHSPRQVIMSKVTGGYLNCPFISNPPPTNVQWKKGSNPVQSGEQYQIFIHNGTLFISSLESTESELVSFTCYITNKYGSDNRTFNMLLVDVPEAPKNFTITSCESDDHSIELTWIASVATNSSEEVENYTLEQSLNGGKFQLSEEVFGKNSTSGVLSGLLSGVTYVFRLRARNLAGLSQPSNSQTCTINDSPPEDGISVCNCAYEEYYIIAGVVGGILLVTVMIIVLVIILAYGKQRYKRRKTINMAVESEEKTKEDQLFKIISNTSNLQMYTV